MATVTETEPEATPATEAGPVTFAPFLLSADRYRRMIEAGIVGNDEPIFLWNGRLVEKMSKGRPHSIAMVELMAVLVRIVPEGWYVRPEQPIRLDNTSMPEPDLSIARGRSRDHIAVDVGPGDLTLVMEISDSSLRSDSQIKYEAYAAQAIPCYWVVNLPHGRIEVYTDPTGPAEQPARYQTRRDYGPGDEISVVLDGNEVGRLAVREILP